MLRSTEGKLQNRNRHSLHRNSNPEGDLLWQRVSREAIARKESRKPTKNRRRKHRPFRPHRAWPSRRVPLARMPGSAGADRLTPVVSRSARTGDGADHARHAILERTCHFPSPRGGLFEKQGTEACLCSPRSKSSSPMHRPLCDPGCMLGCMLACAPRSRRRCVTQRRATGLLSV
jgi:hypothetical protein